MNESTRNIAVGLTALAALGALAAIILLFGFAPAFLRPTYDLTVELEDAQGLYAGAPVRFGGLEVGKVDSLTRRGSMDPGVVLVLAIDETEQLPSDVFATVDRPLFGGGVALVLAPSDPTTIAPALPTDGSGRITASRTSSVGGELTNGLLAQLEGPLERLDELVTEFTQLGATWRTVGANLTMLTRPVSDLERANGAPPSIVSVIDKAERRLAEFESLIESLQSVVDDEQLNADLRETLANARQFTEDLDHTLTRIEPQVTGAVDDLSENLNTSLERLTERYVSLADDLAAVTQRLDTLVAQTQEGQGTLGMMLNDEALYQNLNDTAERMKIATDELILLIRKFAEEGVPVRL